MEAFLAGMQSLTRVYMAGAKLCLQELCQEGPTIKNH